LLGMWKGGRKEASGNSNSRIGPPTMLPKSPIVLLEGAIRNDDKAQVQPVARSRLVGAEPARGIEDRQMLQALGVP
jgi:hypothetical protein